MKNRILILLMLVVFVAVSCSSPADSPSASEQPNQPQEAEQGETGASDDGGDGLAAMEPITLAVPTLYGPGHWLVQPLEDYGAAVEAASNGKIKFEYYYSGALVPVTELGAALQDGVADLTWFIPVYQPADFPIENVMTQLGFVIDPNPLISVMQGVAAKLDWALNSREQMEEYEGSGEIVALLPGWAPSPHYYLICTKDRVTNLAEAGGKRVRVGGPAWAAQAEALGMTGTQLGPSEMYEGMQRGVVDCNMVNLPDMLHNQLYQIAKHVSWSTDISIAGFTSSVLGINADVWNRLPLEAKQLLWDQLPVFLKSFAESSLKSHVDSIKAMQEAGIEFHQWESDMVQALQGHFDRIVSEIPGQLDALTGNGQAILDDYLSKHEKWRDWIVAEYNPGNYTWAEFAEMNEEIDVQPWVDMVWREVLEPHRPR